MKFRENERSGLVRPSHIFFPYFLPFGHKNSFKPKEGVSLSQLVRQRCEKRPVNSEDEELLAALMKEVGEGAARAKASLEKGLADAEQVLAEIRSEV